MIFQELMFKLGFEKKELHYRNNRPYIRIYVNDKESSYYRIEIIKKVTGKYYQMHCRVSTWLYRNEIDADFHMQRVKEELKEMKHIREELKKQGFIDLEEIEYNEW